MKPKSKSDASKWRPDKEGINASGILCWLECREQFRLQVVEGWRNRSEPEPMMFGTLIHWFMHRYYAKGHAPSEQEIHTDLETYSRQWHLDTKMPSTKLSDTLIVCLTKAEPILQMYFKRWAGDFSGKKYPVMTRTVQPVKWISLEKRREVKFEVDGQAFNIFGTLDGVFETKSHNEWIIDTKCLSMINAPDIIDTLQWQVQFMLYAWMWSKIGRKPKGIVMNVIRRPGLVWSDGMTSIDYIHKVLTHIQEKGFDHYFSRFQLELTKKDLLNFEVEFLTPVLTEMLMWWRGDLPHYVNWPHLINKYGRCQMFVPITQGDTSNCYRKADVD